MKPRQTRKPGGWIICHHDGRSGPKTPPEERKPRTLSAALRRLAEDERQGALVRFDELERLARWARRLERGGREEKP